MSRSWKSRVGVLALTATMGIGLVGIASPAGAASNANTAKACQKGGWQSLQTDSGGTFKNQGDCVSYGAKGGTLFSPVVTVSPSTAATVTTPFTISGTGFHANSVTSLTATTPDGQTSTSHPTTNANGDVSEGFPSLGCPPGGLADGSIINESITDAAGVHASAPLTVTTGC